MFLTSPVTGVLAGLAHLVGYIAYHWFVSTGRIKKPNAASWFMWGMGGGIELYIYDGLAGKWWKDFLPFMCSLLGFGTLVRTWWRERSSVQLKRSWDSRRKRTLVWLRRNWGNCVIVIADFSLVYYYNTTGNVVVANQLLALDIIVSFTPMLIAVWEKPYSEHPLPWAIWTLSYALHLATVALDPTSELLEFLYPALYLVLHAAVWAFASMAARKKTS